MVDVIPLLDCPPSRRGRTATTSPVPVVRDKPKGRHLNINLRKDVFRCPRCGFSGGVLDLYALFTPKSPGKRP